MKSNSCSAAKKLWQVAISSLLWWALGSTCFAQEEQGLVAYYSFEEGSGDTVKDQSGNHNDGKIVGTLGGMGDNGGQFFGLHMIGVDSRGNIYTGEVFSGQRVQRFVPVK